MSEILTLSQMIAGTIIDLAAKHGLILVLLAMLGVFSIVSAIGSKVFSSLLSIEGLSLFFNLLLIAWLFAILRVRKELKMGKSMYFYGQSIT